jgi:hypothetical protein
LAPHDKVLYTTDNSSKTARYVVPARRRTIAHADKDVILDQGKNNISVLSCSADVQIVQEDEVKPTFRTPCQYVMIGAIRIKV